MQLEGTLYIFSNYQERDFDEKKLSHSFFSWISKYSHPLFRIKVFGYNIVILMKYKMSVLNKMYNKGKSLQLTYG